MIQGTLEIISTLQVSINVAHYRKSHLHTPTLIIIMYSTDIKFRLGPCIHHRLVGHYWVFCQCNTLSLAALPSTPPCLLATPADYSCIMDVIKSQCLYITCDLIGCLVLTEYTKDLPCITLWACAARSGRGSLGMRISKKRECSSQLKPYTTSPRFTLQQKKPITYSNHSLCKHHYNIL